jgi:hypothetical protein
MLFYSTNQNFKYLWQTTCDKLIVWDSNFIHTKKNLEKYFVSEYEIKNIYEF